MAFDQPPFTWMSSIFNCQVPIYPNANGMRLFALHCSVSAVASSVEFVFFAEGQSGGGRTVKFGHQLVKDDDDPSSVCDANTP